MPNVNDPWLATDGRIPYICVQVSLPAHLTPGQIVAYMAERFQRISNVFNSSAYALNKERTTILSIKKSGEAAILLLPSDGFSVTDAKAPLSALTSTLARSIKTLNDTLGHLDKTNTVSVLSWKLEVSKHVR